jgi:hypothetical protein
MKYGKIVNDVPALCVDENRIPSRVLMKKLDI